MGHNSSAVTVHPIGRYVGYLAPKRSLKDSQLSKILVHARRSPPIDKTDTNQTTPHSKLGRKCNVHMWAHLKIWTFRGVMGQHSERSIHSARSCELALRAVGAACGCPGGAPLA